MKSTTAYRLGHELADSVVLLIALTMLTGCADYHDPVVPEGKPLDELRKEMKRHAKSVFSERTSQQLAYTREGNRSETCNCSYEILDGEVIVSTYPYYEVDFFY